MPTAVANDTAPEVVTYGCRGGTACPGRRRASSAAATGATATSSGRCRTCRSPRPELDPAVLAADDDGLRAVDHVELVVDVVQVVAHRALREVQGPGDLLVRLAAGQEPEHFELAVGEGVGDVALRRPQLAEVHLDAGQQF